MIIKTDIFIMIKFIASRLSYYLDYLTAGFSITATNGNHQRGRNLNKTGQDQDISLVSSIRAMVSMENTAYVWPFTLFSV